MRVQKNTGNKNEEMLKFIQTQKLLSKKVANHYKKVAKMLGIKISELENASFSGAATGYKQFLKKRANKKHNYKVEAYLTWWMRHSIHLFIIKRAILMSAEKPEKVETALLELLE